MTLRGDGRGQRMGYSSELRHLQARHRIYLEPPSDELSFHQQKIFGSTSGVRGLTVSLPSRKSYINN